MNRAPFNAPARRGNILWILLGALALAAGAGAYYFYWKNKPQSTDTRAVLHEVSRDDFVLSITERGEIESAGVTEVRCEVKSKNQPGVAILRVVPEGTQVKAGDFLVELDASVLTEERLTQQIIVNTAEATVVEARNLYETALIAKNEYIDGTYVQERQVIEGEMFVAEENLNRAKEYYEYSKKLAAKGYVNTLQLEADKFAVEKSAKELDAAKTKLRVIDEFIKPKMVKQLESDILISEAKWGAAKRSHELEVERLAEIDDQIAKCTIHAPKDGTVIYAHERDRRGGDEFIVEEGAVVRERQVIIRLPDSATMRVELNVNEALVQYVKPGLPAKVTPIGADGVTLDGVVESVNRFAEPSNWRKADVKEYKAFVTIQDADVGLRPGMTASVTVNCDYVPDALQIPVQAIIQHGGEYYCLVRRDGQWHPRPLVCGATNSEFFVVEKGLEEGDRVAMDPRHYLAQVQLPELPPDSKDTRRATDQSAVADAAAPPATSPEQPSSQSETASERSDS